MPVLAFPVVADGLLVDVVIGVDGIAAAGQLAAGQPITTPIRARGEIDTGSNITVVSAAILQRLGVPMQFQSSTQTAAGQLAVNVFEVSVGVRDFGDLAAPAMGRVDDAGYGVDDGLADGRGTNRPRLSAGLQIRA